MNRKLFLQSLAGITALFSAVPIIAKQEKPTKKDVDDFLNPFKVKGKSWILEKNTYPINWLKSQKMPKGCDVIIDNCDIMLYNHMDMESLAYNAKLNQISYFFTNCTFRFLNGHSLTLQGTTEFNVYKDGTTKLITDNGRKIAKNPSFQ